MNKLYIQFKSTALDDEHELKKTYSPVYNCTEFIWHGYLKKGWKFQLVDENHNPIPYRQYNCGITTDTELSNKELVVNNSLICQDGHYLYHYMNENSYLTFNGKWREVFLYVRVYDNFDNSRWLAVNLKHDVESDIARFKTIGLITDDMKREEMLALLASKGY